jgi:hypothetical protein
MMSKLSFEDLEETIAVDKKSMEEELFAETDDSIPLLSDTVVVLNKTFTQPQDELAWDIWDSIPNEFLWNGSMKSRNGLKYILEQKGISLNDPQVAQECKDKILEEAGKAALTVDDAIFDDLLSMKSDNEVAAVSQEEFTQHVSSKPPQEDNTLQLMQQQMDKMQNIITQLSERVVILEEENKLLNQIKEALNESAAKSETLIKSTPEQQTKTADLSPIEIINTYTTPKEDTPPKKRKRGRPAGYKTSNATKEKQRKARLLKLEKQKRNPINETEHKHRDMQFNVCLN